MPIILPALNYLVDIDAFLARLNGGKTSRLLLARALRYVTNRQVYETQAELEAMWRELGQVTLASLIPPLPRLPVPDGIVLRAEDWLALIALHRRLIRLRVCPDPKCGRFFVDAKHRGKSACSPEHANRHRARKYYATLKETKGRKYRRYLKEQAARMKKYRARLRKRRKAGSA